MTIYAKGPPHGHVGDPLELSSLASVDCSDLKPLRSNGQIKFQTPAETDFDAEIALDLAALRTAALFLNLTKYAAAPAAAAWIGAETFLRALP